MVALTFQAATRAAPSSTPPPAITATPTFDQPRLYINAEVKCRSSIGANFRVLASFPPGTTLDIVAKDTTEGAWLVKIPNSTGTCWVPALDSSPSGDFLALPEVTPQPGTGQPPAAPTNLSWPFYCSYVDGVLYKITINLSWFYTGNDANGFRVYRQDALVADLPADVKAYSDTANVVLGSDLTYSIEAYNDAGVSPRLRHTIASVCK